jgi:hypothetical protein
MGANVFPTPFSGIQEGLIAAKGDLIVGTANDVPGILTVGTNGHTLVAKSSEATGLAWEAPAGGGKVLQVVTATYSTTTSNSTSTFADTGLTATITPTLNTSKVLVLVHHILDRGAQNSANSLDVKLLRDATQLLNHTFLFDTATTLQFVGGWACNYVDSPATTSATTYKTQFRNRNNGASVAINANNTLSSITLLEIGA